MNKQIRKNMITNIIAMVISIGINYLITPYITNQLGIGAYSYVSIITNIISFFTVITYTLNSMVGRFYTISYNQNLDESNKYISTALFSCIGLFIILLPIIIVMTLFLDKIINIDTALSSDVKFAFFASSLTFLLSTVSSVMLTGTYARNKLEVNNYIQILANSLKAIMIFALFNVFSAKIWFIGISGIFQTSVSIILGYLMFKKYIPTVKFSIKLFKKQYAKELLSAGAFNSIILLGNNLMTQVDLLVGNRVILDADLLGQYSIILLFSNTIRQISSAISSAFSPTTIKLYAEKKYNELVEYTNNVVSICGIMLGLVVSLIAILFVPFTKIWLNQDFSSLKALEMFMLLSLVPNLAISQLNVLNQAVNKLKIPAIASIVAGVLNVCLALMFELCFNMGLFGLALASVISLTMRNLVFAPIYAAKITNQKVHVYYKPLIKSIILVLISCSIGELITRYYRINGIVDLFIVGIIMLVFYILLSYIMMSKEEKDKVRSFIKRIWKKKRESKS